LHFWVTKYIHYIKATIIYCASHTTVSSRKRFFFRINPFKIFVSSGVFKSKYKYKTTILMGSISSFQVMNTQR